MPPRKQTAPAPEPVVFDLSMFQEPKHYVWREIEREGQEPLRVKMQDLSIRQTNAIPWGLSVPLRDAFEAVAPYVVEWNFEAVNLETGETVSVPPPAEVGWEVFELLPNPVAGAIVNWLKIPFYMKTEAEKKASSGSTSTTDPPKNGD